MSWSIREYDGLAKNWKDLLEGKEKFPLLLSRV